MTAASMWRTSSSSRYDEPGPGGASTCIGAPESGSGLLVLLRVYQGFLMTISSSTMGRLGATVAGTDPCSTGGHPKLQQKKRRLQMNKFRFVLNALAVLVFTCAFASLAQAQATRTWVS